MIVRIDLGWLEIDLQGKSVSQADAEIHTLIRERERAAFTSMCAQVELQALRERSCSCGGTHTIKDSRLRTVSTLGGETLVQVRRVRCPQSLGRCYMTFYSNKMTEILALPDGFKRHYMLSAMKQMMKDYGEHFDFLGVGMAKMAEIMGLGVPREMADAMKDRKPSEMPQKMADAMKDMKPSE